MIQKFYSWIYNQKKKNENANLKRHMKYLQLHYLQWPRYGSVCQLMNDKEEIGYIYVYIYL